jgi:hypothetical protein
MERGRLLPRPSAAALPVAILNSSLCRAAPQDVILILTLARYDRFRFLHSRFLVNLDRQRMPAEVMLHQ